MTWQGTPVVLGGWRSEGANTEIATDKVWRVVNSRWVELPPLLQPRAAGAAAVVGDRLVVTGGVGANGKIIVVREMGVLRMFVKEKGKWKVAGAGLVPITPQ